MVTDINMITSGRIMKRVKNRANAETANSKSGRNRVRLNVAREEEESKNKRTVKAGTA